MKQLAYHRWCRNRSAENWDLFCLARGTANRLYAAAKARYSADCRRNLDDCASANAWWRTLKGQVFCAESDIRPLCSPGGALVSDPAGKAELLSTWCDGKQSRGIVELPDFRVADCRCDSNSQRSLIGDCLQLSADFDYTSSVEGF